MAQNWILFDCFNTLIDDFDVDGDESGMKPIAHIPVEYGLYETAYDFHLSYLNWRSMHWKEGGDDEVELIDRLRMVLRSTARTPNDDRLIERVVQVMMEAFFESFPATVRIAPGVLNVLDKLKGKVKMGVVSNFFLPGYPEQMLLQNGLSHYFDFIIDSAQMRCKKPGSRIYQEALHRASIRANETNRVLFVGDSFSNDVLAPLSLGMRAIHFDRSEERGGDPTPHSYATMTKWSGFFDELERIKINI